MRKPGKRQTWQRAMESLESRQLLAGDLTGQWVADDLEGLVPDGEVVTVWDDALSGISAHAAGEPRLIRDVFDGHSAVRFNRFDNIDSLVVDAAENPLSGINDFSIALVVATNTTSLSGGATAWFFNTGLVDGSGFFGTTADWGLVMNSTGQFGAGLGGPASSIYSTNAGYNDGDTHVAVFTRTGSTFSLFVDGQLAGQSQAGSSSPRISGSMTFGAINGGSLGFTGDFAEIHTYDGALSDEEVASLSQELLRKYTNVPPVASPDSYSTGENTPLVVEPSAGVLANDTSFKPAPPIAVLQQGPQQGVLELADDGSFTYTPNAGFSGQDQFTYLARAARGEGRSQAVTVSIEVTPAFDVATAVDDDYLVDSSAALSVAAADGVLANDRNPESEPLTATLLEDVAAGELRLEADGSFEYDPQGFAGTATFRYQLRDSQEVRNTAVVTLTVGRALIAVADTYQLQEEQQLSVPAPNGLLANDIQVRNEPLRAVLVDPPSHGRIELSDDGSFVYTPSIDFAGIDEFSYRTDDGVETSQLLGRVVLTSHKHQ